MKVAEKVLDVRSNMTGEKIVMGMAEGATAHIMSLLTNAYSDPELAVIREYSTNAWDAHVQAGVTDPIEITLPGQLSPYFKVRDYGAGLDAEDIRDIYSQYGASTKRNSNEVVGMLGIGCKSALAYCDQFTLIGIKDGIATQVAISRDADGGGGMTIVSQEQTDERSGVEIIVPVKTGNEFKHKSQYFFQFWTPGSVLVNGEQPKYIEGMWIEDGKYMMSEAVNGDTIVMGNVPYPMVEDNSNQRSGRSAWVDGRGWISNHLVAFVDIGEVAFAPSREALTWNTLTKTTVKRVRDEAQAKLDASFLAQIAAAASPADAIAMYRQAVSAGLSDKGQNDAKYKGQKVITKFVRTNDDGTTIKHSMMTSENSYLVSMWRNTYRYRGRKAGERTCSVDFNQVSVWFTNFSGAELTPYKREKLALFFEQKKLTMRSDGTDHRPEQVVFLKELTDTEKFWIKGAKVFDFAEVEAIKIKKDTTRVREDGRPKGSYDGKKDGKWESFLAADIDTTKPLIYTTKRTKGLQSSAYIPADATVVNLGENRINKFLRDFPMAQPIDTYIDAKVKEWAESLDKELVMAYKVQQNSGKVVATLDPTKLDDPRLKRAIKLANMNVVNIAEKIRYARYNYTHEQIIQAALAKVKVDFHPNQEYVLLDSFSHGIAPKHKEHVVLYLNAAYAQQKGGN